MPSRSWIGETSPNPDFVRPVEVFQGFFDIAHPCRHDESVVERSTIIQKSFDKINRILPQNVPRASGSAPEASPERPSSAPNRPKSPPRGPRTIFHQFFVDLGSIFDGFCVDFLFAWSLVWFLFRSIARSTFAVHLRFSCVLRALRTTSSVYNPHLVRV